MFNEEHIWEYFEGGMQGVKNRLCEQIVSALENNPKVDFSKLEEYIGLPSGLIDKIVHNHLRIQIEFNSQILQELCIAFRLDMGDIFLMRELSKEEESDIIDTANAEQFVCMCGAGDEAWSTDSRIELFLITTALRSIDKEEENATSN